MVRRAPRSLDQPHRSRLDPGDPHFAEIIAAHRAAIGDGAAGYSDPESGLYVFTAAYLSARGRCCGQGCRHCPYLASLEGEDRRSLES